MRKESGLHPAQSAILYTLCHHVSARFNQLMKRTDLTSDSFKFHIRKLTSLGYIVKNDDGSYILTPIGKEFANRLDEKTGLQIKQPKISMQMIVENHQGQILAHQRKREPFFNFWGLPSAPLKWGLTAAESAQQEFLKQTGLTANFEVKANLHVHDLDENNDLLEDKLFLLMFARLEDSPEPQPWHGGHSQWMNRGDLLLKEPLFPTTTLTFQILESNQFYTEATCHYTEEEY